LIDAESTLDEVARAVAAAVNSDAQPGTDSTGSPFWTVQLPSRAMGFIGRADYEDDHGMPLSRYGFEVDIGDPGRNVRRQERAARQLYEGLVAATPWSLLLTFDDLQQRIARRDVQASAERTRP